MLPQALKLQEDTLKTRVFVLSLMSLWLLSSYHTMTMAFFWSMDGSLFLSYTHTTLALCWGWRLPVPLSLARALLLKNLSPNHNFPFQLEPCTKIICVFTRFLVEADKQHTEELISEGAACKHCKIWCNNSNNNNMLEFCLTSWHSPERHIVVLISNADISLVLIVSCFADKIYSSAAIYA